MILKLIIIIFFFLIISGIKYENFKNILQYEVKESKLLGNNERGLFALKDYNEGEIIEICPTLYMDKNDIKSTNILNSHFFKGNNDNNSLISLGYCSLINHSKEKQNCSWTVSKDDKSIKMFKRYGDCRL